MDAITSEAGQAIMENFPGPDNAGMRELIRRRISAGESVMGVMLIVSLTETGRRGLERINAAIREKKKANKAARIESARQNIHKVSGTLGSQPHPSPYFAEQGKTLLEYVRWNLDNGNDIGAVYVERALNGE